jgi:ABC-type branched-subunit amino acid transport system substrate-binding protein
LLLLPLLSACRKVEQITCPDLKIGIILAEGSAEGNEQRDGYEIAISVINQNGGVNGCPVEAIFMNEGRPQDRVSTQIAVLELAEQGVIAIAGASSDEATMRAAGVVTPLEIPMVVSREVNEKIIQEGNPLVFQLSPPNTELAQTAIEMLASQLRSLGKVAIFYEQNEFGESAAAAAGQFALDNNLKIVNYQGFSPDSPDTTALYEAITISLPEALLLISSQPEQALDLWLKVGKRLPGLKFVIGNGYGFIGSGFLYDRTGSLAEDIETLIISATWNDDLTCQGIAEYKQEYQNYRRQNDTSGSSAITIRDVQAFASIDLIGHILNQVSDQNDLPRDVSELRLMLAEGLRELTDEQPYSSLIGDIAFGADGQNIINGILIQAIEGQLQTVYPQECAVRDPIPLFPQIQLTPVPLD